MTREGIYPEIWDEAEEDLKDEYLMYFREMKAFIHRVAKNHNGSFVSVG
jgi:hypothetical protein